MHATRSDTGIIASPPPSRVRMLVPSLVFACLVSAVVSSLGAPLLPAIARLHHVDGSTAQWALTATLLTGAIATPTMGRLGDGPLRRKVVLVTLALIVFGCALAALPVGFELFLAGRVLQGLGLGLTPVAIAAARDALPADKSRSAVALLSITTVTGVGLGYPITGLIAQLGGVHAAYWFGTAVAAVALAVAFFVVPEASVRESKPLDVAGAVLLAVALCALLLGISEGETWGWGSAAVLGLLVVAVVLIAGWIVWELRADHPLVDLRLVRHRSVLTADIAALLAGVGMYLLLSLAVRYVQAPTSTGYGLGASAVVAGLVLVPFSAGSFVATRIAPHLAERTSHRAVLPIAAVVLLGGMLMFSFARGSMWQMLVVMGIEGIGVGLVFAVVPGMLLRAVAVSETASAMGFNQVLRYIGYSIGSAMAGMILQIHTAPGATDPDDGGYTASGLLACGMWIVTLVVTLVLPERRTTRAAVVTERDDELMAEESLADAEGR
ncbi:MFS transporter [Gordonia humi]|nr:MFS transporter [Gordonia humi]